MPTPGLADLHRPAEDVQPVAQPGQPGAARIGIAADPIVDDLEGQHIPLVVQADFGAVGPGVLHHVGDRLGHDEVRRRLDRGRQVEVRRADRDRDVHRQVVGQVVHGGRETAFDERPRQDPVDQTAQGPGRGVEAVGQDGRPAGVRAGRVLRQFAGVRRQQHEGALETVVQIAGDLAAFGVTGGEHAPRRLLEGGPADGHLVREPFALERDAGDVRDGGEGGRIGAERGVVDQRPQRRAGRLDTHGRLVWAGRVGRRGPPGGIDVQAIRPAEQQGGRVAEGGGNRPVELAARVDRTGGGRHRPG